MGYRGEEDEERIARCSRCDAMVFAELAGSGRIDANTVCELCGLTIPDLPVVDSDYFNVVMRVGRPPGRVTRFRRAR
jgi:hypothetical protein